MCPLSVTSGRQVLRNRSSESYESGQEAGAVYHRTNLFLQKYSLFSENLQKSDLETAARPPGLRDGQASQMGPLWVSTNSIRRPGVEGEGFQGVGQA